MTDPSSADDGAGDTSDASGAAEGESQSAADPSADEQAFSNIVEGLEAEGVGADAPPLDSDAAAASAVDDDAAAIDPLVAMTAERDGYVDALQRLKAEFDNHRRRSADQASEQRAQAAAGLVEKLLPVLDACEAALSHGAEAVRPIHDQLLETLSTNGLTRVDPAGEPFDPEQHEAVLHEAGDDEAPVVTEVLRTGYAWNGRIIRAAMVKVRG